MVVVGVQETLYFLVEALHRVTTRHIKKPRLSAIESSERKCKEPDLPEPELNEDLARWLALCNPLEFSIMPFFYSISV